MGLDATITTKNISFSERNNNEEVISTVIGIFFNDFSD